MLAELRLVNGMLREQSAVFPDSRAERESVGAAAIDPLARLRAVSILLREGAVGRVRWIFGAAFPEILTPSVRSLFALTRAETESLTNQLDRAMQDIGALALVHATVERNGREIIVKVPEIPGTRQSFERLRDGFRQTLG